MDMERNVASENATVEAVPVNVQAMPVEDDKYEYEGAQVATEVIPMLMQPADPNDASQHIRDDFIYLLCCAFSCSNCDFPSCWGTRSECTLCCHQTSTICCKTVKDEKACCIWQSGGCELVYPRVLYSEYAQCCCCEYYAALPPVQGPFKKINNRPDKITMNFKPAGDARFCHGNCCCYNSCNINFPACIGSYCKSSTFMCQEDECICYKPMCCERQKFNKDTCCIWFHRHYVCVTPQTCYKCIGQFYCCDSRCALPCDEEVPCICGYCCITCCVDWGCQVTCCTTINMLMKGKKGDKLLNTAKSGVGMETTHTVLNPAAAHNRRAQHVTTAQVAHPVK